MTRRIFYHPRTGTRYEFPKDGKKWWGLLNRMRHHRACEYGHDECSTWYGGPCNNEWLSFSEWWHEDTHVAQNDYHSDLDCPWCAEARKTVLDRLAVI